MTGMAHDHLVDRVIGEESHRKCVVGGGRRGVKERGV